MEPVIESLEIFNRLLEMALSEYGLLVAVLLIVCTVLWRRLVKIQDRAVEALIGNTAVLTKLLERLEQHE